MLTSATGPSDNDCLPLAGKCEPWSSAATDCVCRLWVCLRSLLSFVLVHSSAILRSRENALHILFIALLASAAVSKILTTFLYSIKSS